MLKTNIYTILSISHLPQKISITYLIPTNNKQKHSTKNRE